ncbi:hypothetical protein [Kribbella sp. NPDC004536]|uniref:hypothetical protein n=1 Tax=Kribbella sp. NPDC004536 TaxID=3364106 RepID=UPI0036828E65
MLASVADCFLCTDSDDRCVHHAVNAYRCDSSYRSCQVVVAVDEVVRAELTYELFVGR